MAKGSVVDPHWFKCGSGSSILGKRGSGFGSSYKSGFRSRVLMTKILQLIILRPPYRTFKLHEKPSAFKSEHPTLRNMNLTCFLSLRVIFALLDPGLAEQSQCGSMWIRIHNTGEMSE
jgi:hypothetical protein